MKQPISKCTSRPDCGCMMCVGIRFEITTGRTEKDVLEEIANEWMFEFARSRDREMDAEARAAGAFGKFPGDLVMESPAT